MTEGAELKREDDESAFCIRHGVKVTLSLVLVLVLPAAAAAAATAAARHDGVSFTNLLALLAVDNRSRCLTRCAKGAVLSIYLFIRCILCKTPSLPIPACHHPITQPVPPPPCHPPAAGPPAIAVVHPPPQSTSSSTSQAAALCCVPTTTALALPPPVQALLRPATQVASSNRSWKVSWTRTARE